MYNIAICDDSPEFQLKMRNLLEDSVEFENGMTIQTFSCGEELIKSEVENFHMVILDMQMPGMDGMMTAQIVRKKNQDVVLAFCSGIVTPQPEHFEVQPYRYLLKFMDDAVLEKGVLELLQEMKQRKFNLTVEVVSDGKAYRIAPRDVLYISRYKRKSMFVLSEQKDGENVQIVSNEKLEDWYEQLREEGFEYAHTSYIVNMKQIVAVEKDDIMMKNGELLRISRTYKQQFQERFSHYFTKKYRRG